MIRVLLLAALAAVLAAVGWLTLARAPQIALLDAVAVPVAGQPGVWTVGLTMRNEGPPDRLLGVRGEGAAFANPAAPGLAVVLPGGDEAQLAMDGAHAMLSSDEAPGTLVPLTLLFEGGGALSTRVRLSEAQAMDHGAMPGLEADPAPTVALSAPNGTGPDGFAIALQTTGITFREVPEGTPHVPGEGHAHVYLNGLKLGRAYAATMGVGSLPPGNYRLTVALNAHDHRPYLSDGVPVTDSLEFTIP
ncbi:hypothetical protein [Jannaschia formosa]|uniref:hypothetical protein n=1 Tax=Jannaschia formosa TaxID=2259592 RepID=UPI000E1C2176|nr:hypothetical protein [Jannaschia formosa]TFL16933.1 hypothetical protein DR046_17535 [Jannaschia formosa]